MKLPVSGSGIGFASSILYTEKTEALEAGDILVLYTDGLTEAGTRTEAPVNVDMAAILGEIEYGAEYHRRIMEMALSASYRTEFDDDVTLLTARLL